MEKVADLRGALVVQQEVEKLLQLSAQPDVRTLCAALYHETPHRASQTTINADDRNAAHQHMIEAARGCTIC